MDEKYIATLLKKTVIREGVTLFSFVNTMIGEINHQTGIFTDEYGNEFLPFDDDSLLISEYNNAYGENVMLSELEEYLEDEEDELEDEDELEKDEEEKDEESIDELTLNDLAKIYNSLNKDIVYLVNFTKNVKSVRRIEVKPDENIIEEILDDFGDGYLHAYVSEVDEKNNDYLISTEDIVSMIVDKKFDQEKLRELRNKLTFDDIKIEETIDAIDLAIESEGIDTKENPLVKEDKKEEEEKEYNILPFNPKEVYEKVSKVVISQDEAIKRLSTEILRMCLSDKEKNGILLTGSTGVGKTEIMKNIADCLNRPLLFIDSTRLSATGYVGADIEEYLWELYVSCKKDKQKTESAIVFFDEIDKKGSKNKDDVSGQAVLNSLLKFLDGTTYKATESMKGFSGGSVNIKTDNMIVIAGGAFSDVYGEIKNTEIGFGKSSKKEKQEPSLEDFTELGMMPKEFMGRFPIRIHLNDLSVKDLKEILISSSKSPIKLESEIFNKLGVELKVTPEYLDAVSKKAYDRHIGARALKGVVTETTWEPLSVVTENIGEYDSLTLDKETVENPKVYKLTKKNV